MAETVLKGKALLIKAFLALLSLTAIGTIIFSALPEAYCSIENKTVKYIYLSDSRNTATSIFPNIDDDGFHIIDDRCQKGMTIGKWIPIDKENLQLESKSCPAVVVLGYINNCETGELEKYVCDGFGSQENICVPSDEYLTVIG